MSHDGELERRLADLEARVAALESREKSQPDSPVPQSQMAKDSTGIIQISVASKRYQAQDFEAGVSQDYVWFDCAFSATHLERPSRAVKGAIEFCDLFGEEKFRVGYTINDRLEPGQTIRAPGVGFEYNSFMPEHQWMLVTELDDMRVRFRLSQILYQDGTMVEVR